MESSFLRAAIAASAHQLFLSRDSYNAEMAGVAESKLLRFLTILYFAEAGAFLALAPWSLFWLRRIVARSPSVFHPLLLSPYFRSFLVGLGLLHLWVAVRDLEAWRKGLARPRAATGEGAP